MHHYAKKSLVIIAFLLAFLASVHTAHARAIGGSEMTDVPMEENLCALTFDDGPSIFTPQLLDTLKAYSIPATFFMLGTMVNHYPEIALRVAEEGHEIATHTHSHKNLKKLSTARITSEIANGYEALVSLGIIPTYLRPPYGSYDQRVVNIASLYGLDVVLWSMDSLDWKRLPEDYGKIRSVRGELFENNDMHGVFLFHDIHKRTVDDVPRVIEELRRAGCQRFVTLSEYMKGILDPEPPLLMTRRPASTETVVQTVNHTTQVNTKIPEIQHSDAAPVEKAVEKPAQEEEDSGWFGRFKTIFESVE